MRIFSILKSDRHALPLREISDLTREGYRAIDIGNLDIEYEWYLNKDDKKGEVKKHSIAGVEANKEAGYDAYLSQVKKRIV